MNKIVFILSSIQAQRSLKRIEEFIDNGYDVKVYGFSRETEIHTQSDKFEVEIIGTFPNSTKYINRILLLRKGIKKVVKYQSSKNDIFYCFGLDVAITYILLSNRKYLYEEADLMHTYMKFKPVVFLFEIIDKYVIKKSLHTNLTSEGFSKYHFGENIPNNVSICPNKLNKKILKIPPILKEKSRKNLRVAFVGGARFKSVLNFVSVFLQNFPQHEFHFYGNPVSLFEEFEKLKKHPNVYFHGAFKNPDDLPLIYSEIDIVLSAYDIEYENVRYAEPNKLYESIYFDTPIIVSKNTFLSQKVEQLGIGFSIDPLNNEEIISFVQSISKKKIAEKIEVCKSIPKISAISDNTYFFEKLKKSILN